MREKNFQIKIISILLSVLMLQSPVSFAGASNYPALSIPTLFSSLPADAQKKIPAELASFLKEQPFSSGSWSQMSVPSGDASGWVLHIADIHDDAKYQSRLADLLLQISKKIKNISVVLEGQEGNLGLDLYRDAPDRDFVSRVSANLLREKRISGGGYAALIAAPFGVRFWGGENRTLYLSHIAALRKIQFQDRPAIRKIFVENSALLRQLKKRIWNSNLQTMDNALLVGGMPPLSATLDLLSVGRGFNPTLELARMSLSQRPQFDLSTPSSQKQAVRNLRQRLDVQSALNPFKISQSIESEIEDYLKSLCRTSPEETLLQLDRIHRLQLQLADLKLSSYQWSEYQSLRGKLNNVNPIFAPLVKRIYQSDQQLAAQKEFYGFAVARNEALSRSIAKEIIPSNKKIIVCVTGGFHASGMAEVLLKKNIGFLSFVPYVGKVNGEASLASLQNSFFAGDPVSQWIDASLTLALSRPPLPPSAHVMMGVAAVGVGEAQGRHSLSTWGRTLLARLRVELDKIKVAKKGKFSSRVTVDAQFRGCYIRFDLGLFDFAVRIVRGLFNRQSSEFDDRDPSVEFEGIGLHTAHPVRMKITRKAPGYGIQVRTIEVSKIGLMDPRDPKRDEEMRTIKVDLSTILADTRRYSGLSNGYLTIITPEHVLSALSAVGLWDVLIELDGPEFPIGDGTSGYFLEKLVQLKSAPISYAYPKRKSFPLPAPVSFFRNENTFLLAVPLLPNQRASRYLSVVTLPGLVSLPGIPLWGHYEEKDLVHYLKSLAGFPTFVEKSLEDLQRVERLFLGASPVVNILLTWHHHQWPRLNPPAHKIMDAIGDKARLDAQLGENLSGNFFLGGIGHRDVLSLAQKIFAVTKGERFPFQYHHAMDMLAKMHQKGFMSSEALRIAHSWLSIYEHSDDMFDTPLVLMGPEFQKESAEAIRHFFPAKIDAAVTAEFNYPAKELEKNLREYFLSNNGNVLGTILYQIAPQAQLEKLSSLRVSVVEAHEHEVVLRVTLFNDKSIHESYSFSVVMSHPGSSLDVERFQSQKIFLQKAMDKGMVPKSWIGPIRKLDVGEGKMVGVYARDWAPHEGAARFVPLMGPLNQDSPRAPVNWALLGTHKNKTNIRAMSYAVGRTLTSGFLRMYQDAGLKPLGVDGWAPTDVDWNSDATMVDGRCTFSHVRGVGLKSIPQFLFYLTHLSQFVDEAGNNGARKRREWYPFGRYEDTSEILMGMEDELFESYSAVYGPEKALEEIRSWYARYMQVLKDPMKSDLRDFRDVVSKSWLYSERDFGSEFDFLGKLHDKSISTTPLIKIFEKRTIELLGRLNSVRGVNHSIESFEKRFHDLFGVKSFSKLLEWYSNPPAGSEEASRFFGQTEIFGEYSHIFIDWVDLKELNFQLSRKMGARESAKFDFLEHRRLEISALVHPEPANPQALASLTKLLKKFSRLAVIGVSLLNGQRGDMDSGQNLAPPVTPNGETERRLVLESA